MATLVLLFTFLRHNRGFLAAILLLAPIGLTAQTTEAAGTLPEDYLPELKAIIQTALKQSPQMLTQTINLAQSEAGRYGSDAGLWPSLGGSLSYATYGAKSADATASTTSTATGGYYGVNLGQALYQWGALKARSDIGKIAVQISQRQMAEAFRILAMTLRTQYLGLIMKKVYLRNTRYQLQLLETTLTMQEAQLKDGTISEGEIIAPRLNVQETSLILERGTQDYEYAKRVFQRLAGLPGLADESIPMEVPRPAYPQGVAESLLAAFLRDGVQNTLQGQIYTLTLKQNDLNYKIVKTGLLYPKFTFGAGYGLSNSVSASGGTVSQSAVTSYSAGISGYVPVFDGFATRGAKLSALATKRSTELLLNNYLNATGDSAQNLCRQAAFLSRAQDIAEARRALMEDAVKKLTEQFKEGSTAKAVVDGTTAQFYLADYNSISARVEFLNRWTEFVSLVGADPVLNALPARYLHSSHGK